MPTKSLLVSFSGFPGSYYNLVPDNGLANLAACLQAAGHKTRIWDLGTVETLERLYPYDCRAEWEHLYDRAWEAKVAGLAPSARDLEEFYDLDARILAYQKDRIRAIGREMGRYVETQDIDFVGFKLWSGNGFNGSILLAEEIRRLNPSVQIYAGGPHVAMFRERTFAVTPIFDILVHGDGEEAIVQLAQHAQGKLRAEEVVNGIYRDGSAVKLGPSAPFGDLNKIPFPCYRADTYPAMNGSEKLKFLYLEESRGCPYRCNFCGHPSKSGFRRRTMDAPVFVDLVVGLMNEVGFRTFRMCGSSPPMRLQKAIAAELLDRRIQISFCGFAHFREADRDGLALLHQAGCAALLFGLESGSQTILDRAIDKKVKVARIRECLENCRQIGVAAVASIIVPAPFETDETMEETFRLLVDTQPSAVVVNLPMLVPDTPWAREPGRFNFEIDDIEALFVRTMTHRMRDFPLPGSEVPPMGYRLNGKPYTESVIQNAAFEGRLRNHGIATSFRDSAYAIARYAGMSAPDFSLRVRALIMEGRSAELRGLIAGINRKMAEAAPTLS